MPGNQPRRPRARRAARIAVACALASVPLAANQAAHAESDDHAGPVVRGPGCPGIETVRLERILAIELRAAGPPWSALVVTLACPGEALDLILAHAPSGQRLEQGVIADVASGPQRERWLAGVIVDLVVEVFGFSDPRGAHPADDGTSVNTPAPSLSEWLGPAHLGLRLGWRRFNLAHPLSAATIGVHAGRPVSPHLAPFLSASILTGDNQPAGAETNIFAFSITGGVTLSGRLTRRLSLELDLGATLLRHQLTLRDPASSELLTDEKGFGAAFDTAGLLILRAAGIRFGLGPSFGWVVGAPESRATVAATPPAAPRTINGPWLGGVLTIGSAP